MLDKSDLEGCKRALDRIGPSVGRIGALVQVFACEAHRNFPLMAA